MIVVWLALAPGLGDWKQEIKQDLMNAALSGSRIKICVEYESVLDCAQTPALANISGIGNSESPASKAILDRIRDKVARNNAAKDKIKIHYEEEMKKGPATAEP